MMNVNNVINMNVMIQVRDNITLHKMQLQKHMNLMQNMQHVYQELINMKNLLVSVQTKAKRHVDIIMMVIRFVHVT